MIPVVTSSGLSVQDQRSVWSRGGRAPISSHSEKGKLEKPELFIKKHGGALDAFYQGKAAGLKGCMLYITFWKTQSSDRDCQRPGVAMGQGKAEDTEGSGSILYDAVLRDLFVPTPAHRMCVNCIPELVTMFRSWFINCSKGTHGCRISQMQQTVGGEEGCMLSAVCSSFL